MTDEEIFQWAQSLMNGYGALKEIMSFSIENSWIVSIPSCFLQDAVAQRAKVLIVETSHRLQAEMIVARRIHEVTKRGLAVVIVDCNMRRDQMPAIAFTSSTPIG